MSAEILFEKRGGLGEITLNRPQALNTLRYPMIKPLHETLQQWAADPAVIAVLIKGAGEKAFCAGGDIRSLYDGVVSGSAEPYQFFQEEYALDQYIYSFPKPYIALMNGYVMGGGMGISQGARFRIATERSKIAMPEVVIGFFPDVGASYFLPRCPGRIGEYLAVTGVTLDAEDALYANLVDWVLPADKSHAFIEQIEQLKPDTPAAEQLPAILRGAGARNTPIQPSLGSKRAQIDQLFSHPTVHNILAALENAAADGPTWLDETLQLMKTRSPLAMVAALEIVRRGKQLPIAECFAMELALAARWMTAGDFVEGTRALIIDKDKNPQWAYTLDELTPEKLRTLFPLFT